MMNVINVDFNFKIKNGYGGGVCACGGFRPKAPPPQLPGNAGDVMTLICYIINIRQMLKWIRNPCATEAIFFLEEKSILRDLIQNDSMSSFGLRVLICFYPSV